MSTEYIKVLLIWDWKLAKYDILKYTILERISANCPIHLTFIPKLKHFPDILANKQAPKLLDWKFKRNGLKIVFFIHEPQVWQVFRVWSKLYPANRGFFLASLLACTKSFASLVFHVVVLFTFSYSKQADYAKYKLERRERHRTCQKTCQKETSASRISKLLLEHDRNTDKMASISLRKHYDAKRGSYQQNINYFRLHTASGELKTFLLPWHKLRPKHDGVSNLATMKTMSTRF